MTGAPRSLSDVLRPVKHVLLDFDGPLCSVFAGLPAAEVARRLYADVFGGDDEGLVGVTESDPFALLCLIAEVYPDRTHMADRELANLEGEAVLQAKPDLGGESVLRACARSGRTVSIVSNNAAKAIESYLSHRGISAYVSAIFGRALGDPSSMKPNPRLLLEAMRRAGSRPEECIFIGDAPRDVEAGTAAGIATLGYANKPGKDAKLTSAGALRVLGSMELIAEALV